jgi:hypothetical protein
MDYQEQEPIELNKNWLGGHPRELKNGNGTGEKACKPCWNSLRPGMDHGNN